MEIRTVGRCRAIRRAPVGYVSYRGVLPVIVTAQAKDYDPAKTYCRGIKYVAGTFYWCEYVKGERYDTRQGTVDQHELTDAFRNEVVAAKNKHCHYVDWPK